MKGNSIRPRRPTAPLRGSVESCELRILQLDRSVAAVQFVQSLLQGCFGGVTISVEDLRSINARSSSEMGVLAVTFNETDQLGVVREEVLRLRDLGANLSVLGIGSSCSVVASAPFDQFLDGIISREWSGAKDACRRFLENHRTAVQNRAFRAFLDHSVDGYWIWHLDDDNIEWSERTREMTKVRCEDVPKSMQAFSDMIHPMDRDRVEQAIRNHVELGAPYKNIEMRIREAGGQYGHFLANGQALRNESGEPIVLVGSLTDKTLMQRVEQQLEDTQRRFTVLFHHMNDAAVLADVASGIILEANQPAERLWGRSISELVGSHQSQLHPSDLDVEARKAFTDHIDALMKNERATIYVPILRSDGAEIPAEISSSIIEIEGRTTILGVFRDISERVKAERDLRERDAQLQLSSHLASMGTLAAGVAHEINNPLTYLLGNLEYLQQELAELGKNRPEVIEAIEAAYTGGRFVREIVSDLKAISKMDSVPDSCDPCEVIRISSRMAMSDLRHRANLKLDLHPVPQISLSAAKLSQIILNLLANAARAFAANDQAANFIKVAVKSQDSHVEITIEDNGPGITPDDMKRLGEPFFTRNSDKGGTGLGLSICRRIVDEAQGQIQISSEVGRGTKVWLSLPTASISQQESEAPVQTGRGRFNLLLVDDEPLITSLMERMLDGEFRVTTLNDARQAQEILRQDHDFDLVICDLMIPEVTGRDLYKEFSDKIPFFIVTGGAVTGELIEFEELLTKSGNLLHKPFQKKDLLDCVRRVTSEKRSGNHPEKAERAMSSDPDPEIFKELLELLGKDRTFQQFRALSEQVTNLVMSASEMNQEDLEAAAHRICGSARVLGMRELAQSLKQCQTYAAVGEMIPALQEIEKCRDLNEQLSKFSIQGHLR